MLTNGWGISIHIHFFDEKFYSKVKSDFNTPEEQKYEFDNALLKPVLKPFLESISSNKFKSFLGYSEFDSYENFGLLKHLQFKKVFIPINARNPCNTKNVICCRFYRQLHLHQEHIQLLHVAMI